METPLYHEKVGLLSTSPKDESQKDALGTEIKGRAEEVPAWYVLLLDMVDKS